ncbi:hypothetical protein SLEP1_g55377 [Rubroshorea leprosula]|uniref:FLZ-type domain-containing protein n=1 Tax=Rubroshorea leprosula TaxID=152421 RepID=A0AAV5MJ22_9ROSI|nr:hypothetical protein SLEP1_g55377 [Rubroshorea leprosula]
MKRLRIPSDDFVHNPQTPPSINSAVSLFSTESEVYIPKGLSAVPEAATENGTENFLERCFLCKKRLNHNNEVYMYGIFQAFCTPECRVKQIDIDSKMKEVYNQSGGAIGSSLTEEVHGLHFIDWSALRFTE